MEKKRNGFTLIELIVVIAIIGILTAIAVPNVTRYVSDAKDASIDADFSTLFTEASTEISIYQREGNIRFSGDAEYNISKATSSGSSDSQKISYSIKTAIEERMPAKYVLGTASANSDNWEISFTTDSNGKVKDIKIVNRTNVSIDGIMQ